MSLRCLQSCNCFVLTVYGSLYIPTERASLMHVIEAAKSETCVPDLHPYDTADGAFKDRALKFDATWLCFKV